MLGLTEVTIGAQLFVRGLATGFGALFTSSAISQTEFVLDARGRGFGGRTPLLSSAMYFKFSSFFVCSLCSSAYLLFFGMIAVTFGTNVFTGGGLVSMIFGFSSSCCFIFEREALYTFYSRAEAESQRVLVLETKTWKKIR